MYLCYLTKDRRKFFKLKGNTVEQLTAYRYKFWDIFFHKYVVILARECTLTLVKTFPELKGDDFSKAIYSETELISPYRDFDLRYKVLTRKFNQLIVQIWLWDKRLTESLENEKFLRQFIIPEELLFAYGEEALFIVPKEEHYLAVATAKSGYLGSALLPGEPEEELRLFIHSLGAGFKPEKIVVFESGAGGESHTDLVSLKKGLSELFGIEPGKIKMMHRPQDIWPLALKTLKLSEFKVTTEKILPKLFPAFQEIGKLGVYLVIALIIREKASLWEYEKSRKHLIQEISSLERALASKIAQQGEKSDLHREQHEDLERELEMILKGRIWAQDLTFILGGITGVLSEGEYLRNFELREKKLNINLISKNATSTLEKLRKLSFISEIKLTTPPYLDITKKTFTLNLELTIK